MTVWPGQLKLTGWTSPASFAGDGNRLIVEADDGGHAALTDGDGLLHVLAALVDERDGILERKDARCDESRVLAEAVAAGDIRLYAVFLEDLVDDDADRQDSRLRVGRELEVVCRPLEAHVLDGISKCLVGFGKESLGDVILIEKVFAHPNSLCALPRKYECEFIHLSLPPVLDSLLLLCIACIYALFIY